MITLYILLCAGFVQHGFSKITSFDFTQDLPDNAPNDCGGCEVNLQYNYSIPTGKNVVFITPIKYVAQGTKKKNGKCVTDIGFPVNMGASETMTISTKLDSAGAEAYASSVIPSILGTDLCVTTAGPLIPEASSLAIPSSLDTPLPPQTTGTASGSSISGGLDSFGQIGDANSSSSSSSVTRSTSTTIEAVRTVTRPAASPTDSSAQAASSPSSSPKIDNTKRLQIIAGVVTSVLGVAAMILALLLWRRYRRARRQSAATEDFFGGKTPETHERPRHPASISKEPMSPGSVHPEKRTFTELAGDGGSMTSRWRESYYDERKRIPQELRGNEPPRYEMDAEASRARSRSDSISPLTPERVYLSG